MKFSNMPPYMSPCDAGVYSISLPDTLHPAFAGSENKSPAPPVVKSSSSCWNMLCNAIPWKWIIDIFISVSVLSVLALGEYGYIPNIKIGFYCNDPKISHKFNGDTITLLTLFIVTVAVPFIALWIIECFSVSRYEYNMPKSTKQRTVAGARQAMFWYWEYLVGLVIVTLITDMGKLLIGEPRPHFLDTCQPDSAMNCTAGTYIPHFTCTNRDTSSRIVVDSTKSFPSGHASISVYSALFLIWFIQRRFPKNTTFLLIPWLQCLCLLWAMLCSLSRISDNRHHWWDVLSGVVLGVITAVFTIIIFCGDFTVKNCSSSSLQTHKIDSTIKENGHIHSSTINGGVRAQSVRRLLSSTSSYSSSTTPPEERELRDVALA